MIIRGELIKKEWKYYIVNKDERIRELEEELKRVKVDMLSKIMDKESSVSNEDLDYQIQENERLEREKGVLKNWLINAFRYFSRGVSWDIFKSKVDVWDLLDDIELD